MQTAFLPSSVCNRLDEINSDFLWGGTADSSRNHLVSWKKVCQPQTSGGLGLRQARDSNIAMLSKVGWKLDERQDNLWCRVMSGKYLHDQDGFLSSQRHGVGSSTWRGILERREDLGKGVRWRLGDGTSIRFCFDWWTSSKPLAELATGDIPGSLSNLTVVDVLHEGTWDNAMVSSLFPASVLEEIRGTYVSATSDSW